MEKLPDMGMDERSDVIVEIDNLCVDLAGPKGQLMALDGLSLSLVRGQCLALLGESGCGKSLTALSVMGLLPSVASVRDGTVRLDGVDLLGLSPAAMRSYRGTRVAMIFQEPMSSLNPVMRVEAQLGESVRLHQGLAGKALRSRCIELLDQVGIPDPRERLKAYPHELSGGMKQRVMIAMALAGEPDVLIADEPSTALDVTIQAQVLSLLKDLQAERDMALLLITHDLGVVAQMADQVAVMYAGQLVEQAGAEAFFSHPAHPYSRKLFASVPDLRKRGFALNSIEGQVPPLLLRDASGEVASGCRFAPRCDVAVDACWQRDPMELGVGDDAMVRCLVYSEGRPVPERSVIMMAPAKEPDGFDEDADALLRLRGLSVHFFAKRSWFAPASPALKAVDGVDLDVQSGRTLALVGESGCGKTTVAKAALRLIPSQAGELLFEGEDWASMSASQLRHRRGDFQIIFQDPFSSMNPRLRVGEIIEEGLQVLSPQLSAAQREERVTRLLEQVGLAADAAARFPHEFSGGQRQRICIARALAVSPKLLVCDEPTSALDVSVQAQVLNLLRDLQRDLGLAYLFITHNISVVAYLAHEVAVMYLGRIVERGPVKEVLERPQHPYTQALLSAVPEVDRDGQRTIIRLDGDLPSPTDPPSGCHFNPRCQWADDLCRRHYPSARVVSERHWARCHLIKTEAAQTAS